jgi:hypothetical protein
MWILHAISMLGVPPCTHHAKAEFAEEFMPPSFYHAISMLGAPPCSHHDLQLNQ